MKKVAWHIGFGVGALIATFTAFAEPKVVRLRDEGPLARLSERSDHLKISPLELGEGTQLTVVSPLRYDLLNKELSTAVRGIHKELTTLFGSLPPISTTVRIMERKDFLSYTGAPSWTNALYYRQEILIPVNTGEKLDLSDMVRSVRHEYTHAVVNALSDGRCPGWLDEGLAQWIEGPENPALRAALRVWVSRNGPVPLSLLHGGFTKLETAMVPAAYAQSLVTTEHAISSFGFTPLRKFLTGLKDGYTEAHAFMEAFGISLREYERRVSHRVSNM